VVIMSAAAKVIPFPLPVPAPAAKRGPPVVAAAGLVVAAALIGIHAAWPTGLVGHGAYLAVGYGAAVAAWIGVARARDRATRRAIVLLAAGLTLLAIADLTYGIMLWTGDAPAISVADIPWLSSYLAVGAALLMLLRRSDRRQRHDLEGVIDVLVVLVAGSLLAWELAIAATVADSTLPVSVRAVWSLYPIMDAVLLSLVVRLALSRRDRCSILIAGGVACWLASDFAFMLLALSDGFSVWLEVGWLVGAVLLAAGALRGSTIGSRPASRRPSWHNEIGVGRVTVALAPMLVPGTLELRAYLLGEDTNPLPLLAATVMLILLAFVRMARLVGAAKSARLRLESRERYAHALAENSSDAVVVIGVDRQIRHDAPQLADLVGHSGHETRGYDVLSLVEPADLEEATALVERCIAAPGQVFQAELRVNHGEGRQIWLAVRLANLLHDEDVRGIVVNLHDVTDRKRVEEELGHQAFHDSLTGLANRALFRDRLDHALDHNARTGLDPAVVYLDLDGFKTVNDSLGHDVGDDLLREVAARLADAVRRSDTVARLGGDEFAILIEQSSRPLDEATLVADRILQAMTDPIQLGQHHVVLSASLGIAVGDGDSGAADLIRNADIAMYQAKTSGKGAWVTYEPGMRTAAIERLELESDLQEALLRDEFRLLYQPVVELETEQVVGFEALLRWEHPTRGLLSPDRFIPIIEDNGMIVPIGRWVLGEATRAAARWRRQFGTQRPITMAVNLSARQLASVDLAADVAAALAAAGLPASALVLEITETVLVEDPATATMRLNELRDLGVRLAIDDFGTGYSSLSYLRQFPIDILKIDRSFINTITERESVPAIVRGLLDLGRTLQLETVAEGVEQDLQRTQLRDEHCDLAQGFLFARPLPPTEVEQLLATMALGVPPEAPQDQGHADRVPAGS
jgi:diguanylate cyclase (GGDEF)-like protein/PAS domain S-box-containing protein